MGIFCPSLHPAQRCAGLVSPSAASIAAVGAAHAAVVLLLVVFVPAERLVALARPIAVRLIELAPAMPPPTPEHPKPQPPRKAPTTTLPILAATSTAPLAAAEFAVPPQPPAAPPAPIATAMPAPPAPPMPITQARFDADYLQNPKPVYPPASRRLGEEGKVVLRVHVTPEGHAAEIEIKGSSNFPRLDNAARDAVARWRFVPARSGDAPIATWVLVPIVFALES